ncbi:MAG: hypothetical protein V9E86_02130 [Nitrosomonas sp.]
MQTCVKLLNTIEFGEAEKFHLQCTEETFDSSIIEAIAFPRHALCDAVLGNHFTIRKHFSAARGQASEIFAMRLK